MSSRPGLNRRQLLKASAAAGGYFVVSSSSLLGQVGSDQRIVVGVMGMSRGMGLASAFVALPNCVVKYVCDVDEKVLTSAVKGTATKQAANKTTEGAEAVQGVKDFRRILDDKDVHALAVATPDHWHAPAAIMAINAGKHVYVEKPCSHNPREGELLVEATNKYKRLVQMGSQRRTFNNVKEMISKLHNGVIGRVYFARGWYVNNRKSIGKGVVTPAPA